jgi:hypothetical protein
MFAQRSYSSSKDYELGEGLPQQQSPESIYCMLPIELEVSEHVCELDGRNISTTSPPQVQPSCSPLEDNHNQRGRPLSLRTSDDTAALPGPARGLTEVTNQMHTSHYASPQTTIDSPSPNLSPIHMRISSVTNSHVPWTSITKDKSPIESRIAPSESTCTPSTASPISPSRWDSHDHRHQPPMSAQSDENYHRGSFFLDISDYYPTHSCDYIHTVTSLNTPHKLPTSPTASSSQGSGSQPSACEPQYHAADFPGTHQCSCISRFGKYPSHISSFATEDELNDQHVPNLDEHTPWNQASTTALQYQSQHHPPHQPKSEYDQCIFQYSNYSPHSFGGVLPMDHGEPADWKQPFWSTLSLTDQPHVGELPLSPQTTMKGEKRKRGSVLNPMLCKICREEFNGPYQKANLKRHFIHTHYQESGTTKESDKTCRGCGHVYKRADARRKHEWKKHRMEDAKPEKRRKKRQEA